MTQSYNFVAEIHLGSGVVSAFVFPSAAIARALSSTFKVSLPQRLYDHPASCNRLHRGYQECGCPSYTLYYTVINCVYTLISYCMPYFCKKNTLENDMMIILKPPQYGCGLSRYTIILIYFPSLVRSSLVTRISMPPVFDRLQHATTLHLHTASDQNWRCRWPGNEATCRYKVASFPVPRPAFRRLQYGKAGRAWYTFPHVSDVKGRKG